MNKLVIISYINFLQLNDKSRKILSEYDDFLVSINKEEYVVLSKEEKNKLIGVALTDENHNAKIIEHESLKKEIASQKLEFYLKETVPSIGVEVVEQTYKDKHLKLSKPYAPRKMFYAGYNSKKKGGRGGR